MYKSENLVAIDYAGVVNVVRVILWATQNQAASSSDGQQVTSGFVRVAVECGKWRIPSSIARAGAVRQ